MKDSQKPDEKDSRKTAFVFQRVKPGEKGISPKDAELIRQRAKKQLDANSKPAKP